MAIDGKYFHGKVNFDAGFGLGLQHNLGHRQLVDVEGVGAVQPADPAEGLRLLPQHPPRLHHGPHHLPERRRTSHGAR